MVEDCLFCKIIEGSIPSETVYEDDQIVVFKDINPKAEVHLLVVPKEHFDSLNEMQTQHDAVMAHSLRMLPLLAKRQGLDTGFRTIINTGKGGGQVVFHLHIHLLGGSSLAGF
ncbi:Bis(5'-nucleosyl)-tetraphosphatase (asymmetrical) [hydrothermal vent metagenome]|uniref:Bis(5'-nucleosyl)-tetraphosphatase (Asymmetrical) n=1 Tax=hydrothermal vent metagenome TaxID=652676 RepID=A0A3B1AM68_9ZZZZ